MPNGLEWVALLNFLVNFLLLAGTAKLAGRTPALLRSLGAAALGGAMAAGCLIPGFSFLGQLHWHLAKLVLMSALAFGIDASGRKLCCIFSLLTLAVEGLAMVIGRGNSDSLLLCAVGVRLLSQFALGGRPGRQLLPVEITREGKTLCLTALQDTGNELRDPITGEQVLVVGSRCAEELTGLTCEQLKNPLETLSCAPLSGLRLVPYRCIGTQQGMLLAMHLPKVRIGKRERPGIVAFAPLELGGDMYQALTGGGL